MEPLEGDVDRVSVRRRRTDVCANQRLTLSATGTYSLREQEVGSVSFVTTLDPLGGLAGRRDIRPVIIDREDETTSLRLSLRADWRWNKRLTLMATAYWYDEEEERGGFFARDAKRLTGWLGFKYAFEPIHL